MGTQPISFLAQNNKKMINVTIPFHGPAQQFDTLICNVLKVNFSNGLSSFCEFCKPTKANGQQCRLQLIKTAVKAQF